MDMISKLWLFISQYHVINCEMPKASKRPSGPWGLDVWSIDVENVPVQKNARDLGSECVVDRRQSVFSDFFFSFVFLLDSRSFSRTFQKKKKKNKQKNPSRVFRFLITQLPDFFFFHSTYKTIELTLSYTFGFLVTEQLPSLAEFWI